MASQQQIAPVNNISAYVEKVSEKFDALFDNFGLATPMNFFQEKTGVKRSYLATGVMLLLLLLMVFQLHGAHNLCNLLAFIGNYNASIKALGEPGDIRQTLIYWIAFGFFAILDGFQPVVLHCLPVYIALKFIILLHLIPSVSFEQIHAIEEPIEKPSAIEEKPIEKPLAIEEKPIEPSPEQCQEAFAQLCEQGRQTLQAQWGPITRRDEDELPQGMDRDFYQHNVDALQQQYGPIKRYKKHKDNCIMI